MSNLKSGFFGLEPYARVIVVFALFMKITYLQTFMKFYLHNQELAYSQ